VVFREDRRGFGQSAMTPGPFSHRGDLHGLLNVLGIERAHLIGCSAGGQVVTEFTLEHPEMTDSLVLVSSALGGSPFQGEIPKPMQDLTVALKARDVERAAGLAVQIWIDGPHRTPDQVSATIREQAREMARTALPNAFAQEEPLEPSTQGRLSEITAPTLVIVGELDDNSIKAIGEVLASGIRGAQKEVISGVAHLPSMEKPEEFNQRVLEFLLQTSP
jgi:3-oxoadipate enol-lactonase